MKNKLIVLIFMFVSVIFSISANEITTTQGKRVAILPFTSKGNFDALYAEVAQDNFTTELIKGDMYQVVERSQLDKAMKELKFQNGSDFDESSAVEVGKLAGAEIIVIGIITALNNQIIINIRGINVKTGIAEFAEKDSIKTQEGLLRSVEGIAKKLSLSGTQAPSGSQNSTKKTSNVDFSMNSSNSKLTESQEKFVAKFFNLKLGIDPYNMSPEEIRIVYKKHKAALGAGVALAVTGGTSFIFGTIFLLMLSSVFDTVTQVAFGVLGGIFLPAGIIMGCCSIAPFVRASKISKTYKAIHGETISKSYFKTFNKTTSVNYENKSFEIALGYSF